MKCMDLALRRVRRWTVFFVVGLALSGATALPIPTQLELGVRVLGEDLRAGGLVPDAMAAWLQTLRDGIRATEAEAPFMFYGTDWLAFGHFAIALAFVGALRDPLRNRWLFQYGMWICAAVPVWALVCGRSAASPSGGASSTRRSASWGSFRCGCATAGIRMLEANGGTR